MQCAFFFTRITKLIIFLFESTGKKDQMVNRSFVRFKGTGSWMHLNMVYNYYYYYH